MSEEKRSNDIYENKKKMNEEKVICKSFCNEKSKYILAKC